jgi:predicted transcriptional regulator
MKIYPNMPAAQERLNEIRLRQALLSKEMRHQISRTKSNDPLTIESAKAELHSLNSEERRLLAERNSVESQYYDLKDAAAAQQKRADNLRRIVCAIIAAGDDERDFEIIDRAADIEESIQNLIAQN